VALNPWLKSPGLNEVATQVCNIAGTETWVAINLLIVADLEELRSILMKRSGN
jgi:hypothetical protein